MVFDVDAFALQIATNSTTSRSREVVALLNIGSSTNAHHILNGSAFSLCARSRKWEPYTSLLQKGTGFDLRAGRSSQRGYPYPEGVEPRPIQPIIETVSDILLWRFGRPWIFYRATAEESEESIQKILIAGGGSKLPGLPEYLARRFEIPVEMFEAFRQIEVDGRKFDPAYMKEIVPDMAIAVGLALRGVETA